MRATPCHSDAAAEAHRATDYVSMFAGSSAAVHGLCKNPTFSLEAREGAVGVEYRAPKAGAQRSTESHKKKR
jgi:hypothetical protein